MMQSYALMSNSLNDAGQKAEDINEKLDILHNKTDRSLSRMNILNDRLDGLGTKFKTVERAFAIFETIFSFGTICMAVVAMVIGICAICFTARASRTWYIPALIAAGSLLYLLDTYSFFDNLHVPNDYLATAPPLTIIDRVQASPARFWAIVATMCFILAALLPKINYFCEELRDRMAAFPHALYNRLRSSSTTTIKDSTSSFTNLGLPSHHVFQIYREDTPTPPKPQLTFSAPSSHENQPLRIRMESFQRVQSMA
jgi:hypothetical protein